MPATIRSLRRAAPLWPWPLPLAGPLLMLPAMTRAHDGSHLHPHGAEVAWLALAAALLVGAGWLLAQGRR